MQVPILKDILKATILPIKGRSRLSVQELEKQSRSALMVSIEMSYSEKTLNKSCENIQN